MITLLSIGMGAVIYSSTNVKHQIDCTLRKMKLFSYKTFICLTILMDASSPLLCEIYENNTIMTEIN